MAFKFVVLSALLAVASAGVLHPVTYAHVANPAVDAVATTHQNVVRDFDGTVSQYSKYIETPYSSVHKSDTRVNNNVYTPTVAKTVSYAAPSETVVYGHQENTPIVYAHAEPEPTAAVYTHAAPMSKAGTYAASAPAHEYYQHSVPVAKSLSYATPAPAHEYYHHAAPAPVYQHAAPVASVAYNHGPAAATYSHNSPLGSSHTVHYSPAEMVSHISFDGFGTHWGY